MPSPRTQHPTLSGAGHPLCASAGSQREEEAARRGPQSGHRQVVPHASNTGVGFRSSICGTVTGRPPALTPGPEWVSARSRRPRTGSCGRRQTFWGTLLTRPPTPEFDGAGLTFPPAFHLKEKTCRSDDTFPLCVGCADPATPASLRCHRIDPVTPVSLCVAVQTLPRLRPYVSPYRPCRTSPATPMSPTDPATGPCSPQAAAPGSIRTGTSPPE